MLCCVSEPWAPPGRGEPARGVAGRALTWTGAGTTCLALDPYFLPFLSSYWEGRWKNY